MSCPQIIASNPSDDTTNWHPVHFGGDGDRIYQRDVSIANPNGVINLYTWPEIAFVKTVVGAVASRGAQAVCGGRGTFVFCYSTDVGGGVKLRRFDTSNDSAVVLEHYTAAGNFPGVVVGYSYIDERLYVGIGNDGSFDKVNSTTGARTRLYGDPLGTWFQTDGHVPAFTEDGAVWVTGYLDFEDYRLLRYDIATGVKSLFTPPTGDTPGTVVPIPGSGGHVLLRNIHLDSLSYDVAPDGTFTESSCEFPWLVTNDAAFQVLISGDYDDNIWAFVEPSTAWSIGRIT